ncbi:MAG: hypothetical protein JWQ78_148 [Sediminibacterium sp.]|nr:hypothetical protein [Sediminibacterium sp.]
METGKKMDAVQESFVSFLIINPNYCAMQKILLFVLLLLAFACRKKYTHEEVEEKLKKAMTASLYKHIDNDSSRVKYRIEQVFFYEEAKFFDCEFKVNMKQRGHDTIGVMKAMISKDFSKVDRIY